MSVLGQALRFGIVGVANTAVGLAAIYGLMFFLGAHPAAANALGYAIGLGISFVLNRIWTFNSSRPVGRALPQFLAAAALSYLLNLGVVMGGLALFDANPYLMQLAGVCTYTVTMFFACRWFVFPSAADRRLQHGS